MIYESIDKLVSYGLRCGLVSKDDEIFVRNRLLEALHLDEYIEPENVTQDGDLEEILKELLDHACEQGFIDDSIVSRDLFDTKLMGMLTPFPHEVNRKFTELY